MRGSCSASLLKSTVSKARLTSTKRMPQDSLASSACAIHCRIRKKRNWVPASCPWLNCRLQICWSQASFTNHVVLLRNTSNDMEQCNDLLSSGVVPDFFGILAASPPEWAIGNGSEHIQRLDASEPQLHRPTV